MDKQFFRSREFLIALGVSVTLVAGVALAATFAPATTFAASGCSPVPAGTTVASPASTTAPEKDGRVITRTVTYEFRAANVTAGRLALCTDTGGITVVPSPDDKVRVTFTLRAEGASAEERLQGLQVEAASALQGDRLTVGARQVNSPQWSGFLWGGQSAGVSVTVAVPAALAVDVGATTDTGTITLTGIRARDVSLATDTGAVKVTDLPEAGDLRVRTDTGSITVDVATAGDLDLSTDTGRIRAALRTVTTGAMTLRTDTGSIHLTVPRATDVGYDVTASTDTGSITADLGETELKETRKDGPSEHLRLRTKDYATRGVQVRIGATTDTGSITLESR